MATEILLPSGLSIPHDVGDKLLRFCAEEYDYYDGVTSEAPFTISPVDVVITNAVNSWLSRAAWIRSAHRGMARVCEPVLA